MNVARSVPGQIDARTVVALERQADALEKIARWPADFLPAINQALAAAAPVMAQFVDAVRRAAQEVQPALEVLAEALRDKPVDTPRDLG